MRALALLLLVSSTLAGQGRQGDFVTKNFRFTSGESLPELKIHYTTFGAPRTDDRGIVRNAVMILHGTGGTGRSFISPTFAGQLFGPGQLLDSTRYYIILPDGIGHGGSSKPSDGLRMKFPHYGYTDMVRAQYLMLTEGLGVNHLRLILGTSMGCMHSWIWAYTSPAFVDGLAPFACAPTQIAGRNRMIRTMIRDDIMADPAWNNGNYASPPVGGLRPALQLLYTMGSAPLLQHKQAPTRDAADSVIRAYVNGRINTTDANDMLYYFDASSDYDPSPHLGEITTPILAINSADDFVNPPELHIVEPLIAKVKSAKFVLIPISDATRGHGTHSLPSVWGSYLRDFLSTLAER
jgi:homoserine O-acetyltransferase